MDLWHFIFNYLCRNRFSGYAVLPGDSLLFAAGALAASTGAMDPWLLGALLFIAAVLGDTVNYHIGRFIGPRVFEMNSRFINKQHLIKTQEFCSSWWQDDYFARFVPFARTLPLLLRVLVA